MNNRQMTRNERRLYRKKLREQRLMALGILAICIFALWMCSTGTTPQDRDATAVLIMAPMGFWMLFTKGIVIC